MKNSCRLHIYKCILDDAKSWLDNILLVTKSHSHLNTTTPACQSKLTKEESYINLMCSCRCSCCFGFGGSSKVVLNKRLGLMPTPSLDLVVGSSGDPKSWGKKSSETPPHRGGSQLLIVDYFQALGGWLCHLCPFSLQDLQGLLICSCSFLASLSITCRGFKMMRIHLFL